MSEDKKNRKLTADEILSEFMDKLSGSSAPSESDAVPPDTVIEEDDDAITVTAVSDDEGEEVLTETPVDPDFVDDGISVISDEEEKPLGKEPPCLYDPDEYEPDEIDLFTGFDEIIPEPQDTELTSAYFEEDEDSIGDEEEASPTEKANDASVDNQKAASPEKAESQEEADSPKKEKSKKKGSFRDLFPRREDSVFEIIRKLVFLIAVIVFIGAGVMLAVTLIQSKRAVDLKNNLTSELEQFEVTTITTIDENGNVIEIEPTQEQQNIAAMDKLAYLKSKNPNTVGYLTISGVDVYEPILQCGDNSYYLTHAFDGTENKAGAVFLDYRAEISAERQSDMLVLYGHNQRDGTMFGNLKQYKRNVEFYKRNPFLTFETEYGAQKYVIFAYFVTNTLPKHDSNGEVFYYHDYPELDSEEVYSWYMGQVAKRNEIISPIDVTYGDKFLVLSTCSNEYSGSRFVVMARKLRPGESPSEIDFSGTQLNYGSNEIDWYAITSDMTTTLDSSELESSLHQSMAEDWFATIGEALQSLHGTDTEEWQNTESGADTGISGTDGTPAVTEPPRDTSDTNADTAVPELPSDTSDNGTVTEPPQDNSDTNADTSVPEDSGSSSSDSSDPETTAVTDENGSEVTDDSDTDTETSVSETTGTRGGGAAAPG